MMKDGMFDDIRKKLEFLEEEAPGGLWEGIESSLPPAAAPLERKKVRSLRWLWMPAAASKFGKYIIPSSVKLLPTPSILSVSGSCGKP